MVNAFEKMDRMYRYQRYFYDFTRKYYLLGRDKLLKQITVKDDDNLLELGCGTARNLIILAQKYPNANFFGLDASAEMLKTAQKKIEAKGLTNITLKPSLADEFSFDKTFDLDDKFDTCFFSYALSIIPPWQASLEGALDNLKPGGNLYIVDFYDGKDLPTWFRKLLNAWLKQFHVAYPRELIPHLESLEKQGAGELKVKSIAKSYAFIAELRKKY
jgi:S-adenosylmethionine-diacylgycerolhomoserine-N-methlytransferase